MLRGFIGGVGFCLYLVALISLSAGYGTGPWLLGILSAIGMAMYVGSLMAD